MYSFADNYENKLQEIEADIEAGAHYYKEYLDVLPVYLQQKYIQKCAENPHYEVDIWVYNQFTENQKNLFHKALIKYGEEVDSDVVKLLPNDIREKWLAKYLENVDYIPEGISDFLDKEIHADIIKKIYKNVKNKSYRDPYLFNLLPAELKMDYILHEGSKILGQNAIDWLKSFKKANTREELFKIIIDEQV